ncbi:class I SAM-dependent methyltransferase [Candidatus Omnitrophota bacterium]
MPIGNAYATGNIIAFIDQYHVKNKALTVLDIGCGMGHNGFIFREMFDIRYMRLKPKDWTHSLEGIEVFEDYRNPVWDYYYNKVTVEDCLKVLPALADAKYDIIFATEILEHFEKEKVYELLDLLLTKITADGSIIITIPTSKKEAVLAQKNAHGNVHETHRTYLQFEDFQRYHIRYKVNNGIFMISKK